MPSEKSIINKIGLYDASFVWLFLVVYLVILLAITPGIILKILPAILLFCFFVSILLFWRGRENARRILKENNSPLRIAVEGGLIGTFAFLFLILFFTYQLLKTPELLWTDKEMFSTTLEILFLTIFFGFITGAFGGFVMEKFNKKTIKKFII